jgi:hypothetical protein
LLACFLIRKLLDLIIELVWTGLPTIPVLQVCWGVGRVAGCGGPTIWGRISSEGILAWRKKTPSSTCIKCWEIGMNLIHLFLNVNYIYWWINEDGLVVDLFWGKWGASELDLISMDIKSLLHSLLLFFFFRWDHSLLLCSSR